MGGRMRKTVCLVLLAAILLIPMLTIQPAHARIHQFWAKGYYKRDFNDPEYGRVDYVYIQGATAEFRIKVLNDHHAPEANFTVYVRPEWGGEYVSEEKNVTLRYYEVRDFYVKNVPIPTDRNGVFWLNVTIKYFYSTGSGRASYNQYVSICIWPEAKKTAYEKWYNASLLYDALWEYYYYAYYPPSSYIPELYAAGDLIDKAYDHLSKGEYDLASQTADQAMNILLDIKSKVTSFSSEYDNAMLEQQKAYTDYYKSQAELNNAQIELIRAQTIAWYGFLILAILGGVAAILFGLAFLRYMEAKRLELLHKLSAGE